MIVGYRYVFVQQRINAVVQWVLFFHLVTFGWIFFRAGDMHQIGAMVGSLWGNFHLSAENAFLFLNFAFLVMPLLLLQIWQWRRNDLLFFTRVHWAWQSALYAAIFYLIVGFGVMRPEQFIYFQF